MSRRKDYKMKKIRKLNIGATIVASLFATVFLVFWILFSLLSYMTNLFQAKIDATASNLKTYNEIVDHYFSTGISDAKIIWNLFQLIRHSFALFQHLLFWTSKTI